MCVCVCVCVCVCKRECVRVCVKEREAWKRENPKKETSQDVAASQSCDAPSLSYETKKQKYYSYRSYLL